MTGDTRNAGLTSKYPALVRAADRSPWLRPSRPQASGRRRHCPKSLGRARGLGLQGPAADLCHLRKPLPKPAKRRVVRDARCRLNLGVRVVIHLRAMYDVNDMSLDDVLLCVELLHFFDDPHLTGDQSHDALVRALLGLLRRLAHCCAVYRRLLSYVVERRRAQVREPASPVGLVQPLIIMNGSVQVLGVSNLGRVHRRVRSGTARPTGQRTFGYRVRQKPSRRECRGPRSEGTRPSPARCIGLASSLGTTTRK